MAAYFSATGTTAYPACTLADAAGADLMEIQPKAPYIRADLNWIDKHSRSTLEMRDPSARPEIANVPINLGAYNTMFIAFPIWWYVAPNIVNIFPERCDLTGKTIIPFAISGGSGMGKTNKRLLPAARVRNSKTAKFSPQTQVWKRSAHGRTAFRNKRYVSAGLSAETFFTAFSA